MVQISDGKAVDVGPRSAHIANLDYEVYTDAEKIVNGNCLRCHSSTMGNVCVDKGKDGSATCTKCHSRIPHGSNPLEGGIRVE